MLDLLEQARVHAMAPGNRYNPVARVIHLESSLLAPYNTAGEILELKFARAQALLELGREDEAIELYEELVDTGHPNQKNYAIRGLAMAWMRVGERSNCIKGHESESCLMPVRGLGLHRDTIGSSKAIEQFTRLLKTNPYDYESRWLLNVAYMTMGKYPDHVPNEFLLPGLAGDTAVSVNPFSDIAAGVGIDVNNMAGGTVIDDFDNDGFLDIISSSMDLAEGMHYFKNNGDGTFTNRTVASGLSGLRGGLNMIQADYDNDGDKDILILRGAWKGLYGREPNSLLQNQGDGVFKDVTVLSGMLSFHPTQAATWNDFDNDGWLDVFIGNESEPHDTHSSELYINNGDGTFRDIAAVALCEVDLFVKGVTSGDYDKDGWKDIFVSTMSGQRMLLRNLGKTGDEISFQNVTERAGLSADKGNSFPTWFWDYNNDGWLDIFACDYTFENSLAFYAAAEKLDVPAGNPNKAFLYRNNHDGTFTNVAAEVGLDKIIFAMGANFGDIDNDGYPDMYLGTGNPPYQSVVPNKMFKNMGGSRFADVTTSARVGHLQKGHAVAFADMDNDGDQDIYIEMGGAFAGDAYQNAFFMNPGQGNNNWLKIELKGTESNADAIGTTLEVTFTENGVKRTIYSEVNSGGSFGASPLRRELGVGAAKQIDAIKIRWHGSGKVETFNNVGTNQMIRIVEGKKRITKIPCTPFIWKVNDPLCLPPGNPGPRI